MSSNQGSVSSNGRPQGGLSLGTYVGYGVGQVGGQVLRDTPGLILLIYMTTVAGLEAALASLVILIAKTWVVFADPAFGLLSDRTQSKWGRRRPFILIGGLSAAVCFFFLFFSPNFQGQMAIFAYMTFLYVLLNTGYSAFSVPYLTMATEMSDDADERTKILSFRNAFLALGLLVAGALSPKIIEYATVDLGQSPREGYELMGSILSAIIAITTIWVFFGTASVSQSDAKQTTIPLSDQIKAALENRPFVILILANIVQYISAGLGYAGSFFFLAYSVGLNMSVFAVVPIWILVMSITSICAMPLFVIWSARAGKLSVYKWCLIMFAITTQIYFFATPESLWIVYLAAFFIGLFNSGFILMSFSVLTDTIAYDRMVTGVSREGALSSVYSAVEKIANALGAVIFGFFLSIIGFIETSDGTFAQQTDSTLRSIALFYILAPAILHSASILILNKYDLTKEKLDQLNANAEAAAPAE